MCFSQNFFIIFLFITSTLVAQEGAFRLLDADRITPKGYSQFLNSGLVRETPEEQPTHSYFSGIGDFFSQWDPWQSTQLQASQENSQYLRWSDDFYDEQMLSSSILRTAFPGSYHYDSLASRAYAHDVIVGLSWRDMATYCHYYSLNHRDAQCLLLKPIHNDSHEDCFLRTNYVFYHLYYPGDAAHKNMMQQEGDDSTMRSHDLLFESIVGGVITLAPILGVGAVYFHRNYSSNRILLHHIEVPLSGNHLNQLQDGEAA